MTDAVTERDITAEWESAINDAIKAIIKGGRPWRPSDRSPSSVGYQERLRIMAMVREYGGLRYTHGYRDGMGK